MGVVDPQRTADDGPRAPDVSLDMSIGALCSVLRYRRSRALIRMGVAAVDIDADDEVGKFLTMGDAAAYIAGIEHGDDWTEAQYDTIWTALYDLHVPQLEAADLVSHRRVDGTHLIVPNEELFDARELLAYLNEVTAE